MCADFFIEKVKISSHIMDWKLNQMDLMHYLIFRNEGVPLSITRYNSNIQSSAVWNDYMKKFWEK